MIEIAIAAPGGPEVLQPREAARPEPKVGEVVIRVAAAGVNYPDLFQRRGRYDPPPGHSTVPGLEVSGTVVALGDGVESFGIGDEVIALCNGGGYAEYVAVPAGQTLPLPRGITMIDGAAMPETFFTVSQTLVMRAGLAPGHWVLVHGAAGGIGGAAIWISRALGAKAIAVVSSAERAAYATTLGAAATIDRTNEDFVARTMEITGGYGADRIVDILGGDVTGKNVEAAAKHGHLVLIGTLDGFHGGIALGRMLAKQLTLSASTLRGQPPEVKAAIADRLRFDILPAVEADPPPLRVQRYPLEKASEAHRAMEERGVIGKLVLITDFGYSFGR
jgi:NADPH2:quinone reductase